MHFVNDCLHSYRKSNVSVCVGVDGEEDAEAVGEADDEVDEEAVCHSPACEGMWKQKYIQLMRFTVHSLFLFNSFSVLSLSLTSSVSV